MKKILGIVVLGLLLSGNAYTKEIAIDHFGTYESDGEKFTRNFISNTTEGLVHFSLVHCKNLTLGS